jgi:dihydroorotase
MANVLSIKAVNLMDFPITVNVVNTEERNIYKALLVKTEKGYKLARENEKCRADNDLFISPGWIDLHAHIYDGFTSLGVPADLIGLRKGVHIITDAGSAGEATLQGFKKYIVPNNKTELRAWLNISSIGLVHLREYSDLRFLDVEKTVKTALDNRPLICGIKVRSSGIIVEDKGIEPLKIAVQAARKAGLPLMVHIGEMPPMINEILEYLDKGDVVTHCFHGKDGYPWDIEGNPIPALKRALDRGVRLDIGHGAASFNFDVCKRALSHKLPMISISTDAHIRNIKGPVYDLPTTMTKILNCGMSLMDTITGVTKAPSEILGISQWCDLDGYIKNATLFRVQKNASSVKTLMDSCGNKMSPENIITPVSVISNYELNLLNSQ